MAPPPLQIRVDRVIQMFEAPPMIPVPTLRFEKPDRFVRGEQSPEVHIVEVSAIIRNDHQLEQWKALVGKILNVQEDTA